MRPEEGAAVPDTQPGAHTTLFAASSGWHVGGTYSATTVEDSPLPPSSRHRSGTYSYLASCLVRSRRSSLRPILRQLPCKSPLVPSIGSGGSVCLLRPLTLSISSDVDAVRKGFKARPPLLRQIALVRDLGRADGCSHSSESLPTCQRFRPNPLIAFTVSA